MQRLTTSFWQFVALESCAPAWVNELPRKPGDRLIGFCESLPETEPFALADESFFVKKDGQWRRGEYREICQLEGYKAEAFMATRLRIELSNGDELNYYGRNAFSLMGALRIFMNDLSKEVFLHLSEELSLALNTLAAKEGRNRNDLAKELLSESLKANLGI